MGLVEGANPNGEEKNGKMGIPDPVCLGKQRELES